MISVPKEHRALQLLQQCRWCLHPVDPVFRGPPETGMPGKQIWPFFYFKKKTEKIRNFFKIYFFQDEEIWKRYMKRFAKTVVKVLIAYSDVLKRDFPNHVKDESTVSTAVGFIYFQWLLQKLSCAIYFQWLLQKLSRNTYLQLLWEKLFPMIVARMILYYLFPIIVAKIIL